MTLEDYNSYCAGLGQTTHVVQWGGSHVWKIGGKVFAMGTPDGDQLADCTFKFRPISFHILKDQPGCQGAPYLASRGMKWIQRFSDETLSDDDLKDYVAESFRLIANALSKKKQRELGLLD